VSPRKSISVLAALFVVLVSALAVTGRATAGGPASHSCPPPYNEESPLKMITRGVSCETAEQIVLKVNALVISDKPLHPIAGFHCFVKFKSGRPIHCSRGEQTIRSPIPVGP
jgi:hypothetical protein